MQDTYQEALIMILLVSLLVISLATIIIMAVIKYQKRQQIHFKEKQDLQQNYQQELLRTQLEIQEQTFRIISQEIHDNIGQMLSLAKLNLATINLPDDEKNFEKIVDSRDLVGKAIQDLRDLSRTLNTDNIKRTGLPKAIELELALLQKTGSITAELQVVGNPLIGDSEKELIIFRIVQEALHNIIKHAGASTVRIKATYQPERLQLAISDDGVGFDSKKFSAEGSGLGNMRNRANMIGADLKLESTFNHGTKIFISLPLIQ